MSELKRRRPRRSNGCEPCRSRRARCSEAKPICKECSKRRIACIYGSSNVIFQSENAFIEQAFTKDRAKRKVAQTQESSPRHSESPSYAQERAKHDDSRLSAFDNRQQLHDEWASSPSIDSEPMAITLLGSESPELYLIRPRPVSNSETQALYVFFNDFLPCEIVLGNHQEWSVTLQSQLNTNSVLRNIVLAIARINIGATISDYLTARENRLKALEHYSQAVHDLQSALNDPSRTLHDDVLIAVCLLGVFEMVKGSSVSTLEQHQRGGLSLIRARGPAAHQKSNLASLVASGFQNHSIRCALESKTMTFFAEPEWIEAAQQWKPMGFNKWCGTKLNSILLRLTVLNSPEGHDFMNARDLESEILWTRQQWLKDKRSVSNRVLESQSVRARAINLSTSPFGPYSSCYDKCDDSYRMTLASVTFDWALLTLYLCYPKLLIEENQGYLVMVRLIQAVQ